MTLIAVYKQSLRFWMDGSKRRIVKLQQSFTILLVDETISPLI